MRDRHRGVAPSTGARLLAALVLAANGACGPVDVATVTLRVREPADSNIVEDRKLAEIRPVLDGRDLGVTQNDLTMTFAIESDDEKDGATDHALVFSFTVFGGDNEITGFGRSNTVRIPTARSVQDGGKPADLVVPLLIAPTNVVTRVLSDFPGPRTGATVCATGTGAAWVFGGTPTGGAGEATSYYFDGQTLDARTAIGTNAMGAPRACGADAGGRVTVLADADAAAVPPIDAGLFQASGRAAPELACALTGADAPDGASAAVVVSGDTAFAFGSTKYAVLADGSCVTRAYGGGLTLGVPVATAIAGGAAIVGSLTTGWVVVTAAGEETTGGQEFAGAGPDFLLGVAGDGVVNVLVPKRKDGNTTLANEGALTIGDRTVLGGARGPANEIVILARGVADTVVFVDRKRITLPTPRDAVVRTVGGALVFFGGDVEGFDALVVQ